MHQQKHKLFHLTDMILSLKYASCALQGEVDRLEGLVEAEAARADYILDAAEENIDAFAGTLHQQNHRHQRRRQADLQRQRQALARAAAEELVHERRQRMSKLREVVDWGRSLSNDDQQLLFTF